MNERLHAAEHPSPQPRDRHFPERLVNQSRLRVAIALAALYAGAVAASLLIAQLSLEVSTIWLASGIGLVGVLIWGYWLLPLVLLSHVLASVTVGTVPPHATAGLALIATTEIGVSAWLLTGRRTGRALTFDLAGMARFALYCLLVVPMTGALAATALLWLLGIISPEDTFLIARNWWLSVALGILCLTPLLNNWLVHGVPRFRGRWQEALAVLAALLVASSLILSYQLSLQNPVEAVFYAALPLLLWASVFLRETGAATALALLALLALSVNALVPEQGVPIWNTGAHLMAFGLMGLVIANAQSNLEEAISERSRQANLELLAYQDILTGLANRHRLLQTLDEAMTRLRDGGPGFAVLMIDLDGFKPVNDLHGHDVGDEVLRVIGARLRSSHRAGDLIARFGGDEFVAVLRGCPDTTRARVVAHRLIEQVSRPIPIRLADPDPLTVEVGLSVGIAHTEHGAETVETLIKQADMALYRAKGTGGRVATASEPG